MSPIEIDSAKTKVRDEDKNEALTLDKGHIIDSLENGTAASNHGGEPRTSYLRSATQSAIALFSDNRETQHQLGDYSAEFVKTAFLFLKGKVPLAGTAALYALDQMAPGETPTQHAINGTIGIAKGLGLKATFRAFEHVQQAGIKGVLLGSTSRLLETATDSRNYFDGAGNFSLTSGLNNAWNLSTNKEALAMDVALFGAAGLMGAGASKLVHENNPLVKTAIAGFTFGFSRGSLGAIDEQIRSGRNHTNLDWGSVLQEGATKGGLDLIASLPAGWQSANHMRDTRNRLFSVLEQARPSTSENVLLSFSAAKAARDTATIVPKLPFENLAMPDTNQSFSELTARLTPPVRRSAREPLPVLDTSKPLQRSDNVHDFLRQNIQLVETAVVTQKLKGTEIEFVIPVEYSKSLAQVRTLRQEIAKANASGDGAKVAEAVDRLNRHPYGDRVLPEDIARAIADTPVPQLIKKVILLDSHNPLDLHFGRVHRPGFESAAQATPDGTLTLYQATSPPEVGYRYSNTRERVMHEWSHLLLWGQPGTIPKFTNALDLEPSARARAPYSPKDVEEAVTIQIGEKLLHPDPDVFWLAARQNPVTTALASDVLRQSISSRAVPTPAWMRNRLAEIDGQIRPLAMDRLGAAAKSGTQSTEQAAVRALLDLSGEAALGNLNGTGNVDLSRVTLTETGMLNLAANPSLHSIRLNYAQFPEHSLGSLTQLKLRSLELSGTPVGDSAVPTLSQMKSLGFLDITQTNITALGYLTLRAALPETVIIK